MRVHDFQSPPRSGERTRAQATTPFSRSSSLRNVAQPRSAPGSGPGGRGCESRHSDQSPSGGSMRSGDRRWFETSRMPPCVEVRPRSAAPMTRCARVGPATATVIAATSSRRSSIPPPSSGSCIGVVTEPVWNAGDARASRSDSSSFHRGECKWDYIGSRSTRFDTESSVPPGPDVGVNVSQTSSPLSFRKVQWPWWPHRLRTPERHRT